MTQLPVVDTEHPVSPVLERPLDNTALATFMECPRKYEYSMVRHRRSPRDQTSPALCYGTAWHAAMETHYRTGGDRAAVFDAVLKAWVQHSRADDHRTFERVLLEYDNYVEKYGMPDQEDAKTLGFPENPVIELSVNAYWPGALHPYAGKIDRIIEWNGHLYVEDHKTTSQMGPYYFKQFELNNQMMGYVWVAQLYTKQRVAGVRINAHACLKRDSKFERQVISYSPDRLEQWAENYDHWVERIRAAYASGDFPNNFQACAGKYGMCQYSGVCSLPPRLRDRVLEQEFDYAPWNPLDDGSENGD